MPIFIVHSKIVQGRVLALRQRDILQHRGRQLLFLAQLHYLLHALLSNLGASLSKLFPLLLAISYSFKELLSFQVCATKVVVFVLAALELLQLLLGFKKHLLFVFT